MGRLYIYPQWEPTVPSILGGYNLIYWGFKTFIFHGFGVQGLHLPPKSTIHEGKFYHIPMDPID